MNFNLLNLILIQVIRLWKQYRDANPNQPSLTDAEVIEMLRMDSQALVDKADEWLAAHPPTV